jgi:hypothetical protein
MKGKIEFDLSDIDDALAFKRAVYADDMWIALSNIMHWSKHDIKASGHEMLSEIREQILNRLPNIEELGL